MEGQRCVGRKMSGTQESARGGTNIPSLSRADMQKIEDIYGFVESCKMQSFSTTKVIVPKNDLYDLLDDLRRDVPEEIKRYRKMLNQRDAILEDAEWCNLLYNRLTKYGRKGNCRCLREYRQ